VKLQLVVRDFGYDNGWRRDKHPRYCANVGGDSFVDDIVGFGDAGVYVALSNRDGTFQAPKLVVRDFGYANGWRVDKHPRYCADVTGDNLDDIVGFGDAGVYVALNNGDGTFQSPKLVVPDFGYDDGWRAGRHPRFLARVFPTRGHDIVGFGNAGVWVAMNNGDGSFQSPQMVEPFFGLGPAGWDAEKHLRLVGKLNDDVFDDIVGFGNSGVWVARNNGDGTFQAPQLAVQNLGYNDGWRADRHPRFVARLKRSSASSSRDIVGFGNSGVWIARNNGDGTFQAPQLALRDLGYDNGWRVDKHPRYCANVTGNYLDEVVGFGNAGVWVASDL
jgi:hypothetical protein